MSNSGSVQKLDFNDEFMLASVEKRIQEGDFFGALRLLNKRNGMHRMTCEASLLAADIYEALGLHTRSADAWYHFLDTCNEADFAEGYEGLAVAFMNMGDEMNSAMYYHKMLAEDGNATPENRAAVAELFQHEKSHLRVVHSEDGNTDSAQFIRDGLVHLKEGNFPAARQDFACVAQNSPDYAQAVGLSAMCALMNGESETAEKECLEILHDYPDNVQALTTYCAILSDRGDKERAKEVALRLATLPAQDVDELYKIATALCETGLHEQAFEKLAELNEKLNFDKTVLYFYAVAARHTGRIKEAIDALETICTLYPRSGVADYYLARLRAYESGDGALPSMTYFYRVPNDEHEFIYKFLLRLAEKEDEELEMLADLPDLKDYFLIAFDEMDGHDDKLQLLAARIAVRTRNDEFLREVLLDYCGSDFIKFYILHELTVRNEDNSFGTVICNMYKEFFFVSIEIGQRKQKEFLEAYAEVYSKFAFLGKECEEKIIRAGEEVYRALSIAEAWDCMDEQEALAAVIYREAHFKFGDHTLSAICDLFGAKIEIARDILDRIL